MGTQAWLPAAQPKPSQLKADARSVPSGEPRPQRWHGVCQEGSGVGRGNGTASSPKNKNKLALLRSTDRLSSTSSQTPPPSLLQPPPPREPNPKPFHTRFAGFVLFIARVWDKWGSRRGRGTVSLQPCLQSLILCAEEVCAFLTPQGNGVCRQRCKALLLSVVPRGSRSKRHPWRR